MRRRIEDEKFINLIWKFLRAGYVEDWVFHKTYSGTPQGGIISPTLSNIYLNELDKYIEEYTSIFNKGDKRRHNLTYHNLASKITYHKHKNKREWSNLNKETRAVRANELKNSTKS